MTKLEFWAKIQLAMEKNAVYYFSSYGVTPFSLPFDENLVIDEDAWHDQGFINCIEDAVNEACYDIRFSKNRVWTTCTVSKFNAPSWGESQELLPLLMEYFEKEEKDA